MERKMMDEKRQLMRKKSFEVSEENREQIKRRKQPVKEKERPSTAWDFDVFISFRGKDTRKGFTSHLHERLKTHGITAFIDSEDLKKGKKIRDLITHIEGSKIFLPVFSKNYADSKWCLREIAKMMEINKREGEKRPIIPVFYDVDPSDVKDPKSSFGEALEKLQRDEGLSEEHINQWRSALTEAGKISGFCLSEANGNEAKLITLIGKDVSNRLCKVPFDIQPIGIGPDIDTLKQMLEKKEEGVCMIGICGLGGIGKTTLAMALYNELSLVFGSSCFLSDIRNNEDKEGLHSLQAKLLEKVLGEKIPVDKGEEGVNLIRQRFRRKKILLILDDVDHTHQLEAFTAKLGEKVQWFGAGSKIIVTTRDEQVLTRHGLQKEDIHFPEGLDVEHSLELFCHHAFHRDQPLAALGELPQQVVNVAQGLPLALIVFGSLCWDLKEKEEWEEMLEKLKCDDQNKKVHERLKVSYDSLDRSERSVFLDIACFFIGWEKEYPVYMWKACDYSPRLALKVLQHKSLIKINEHDRFEMHDQIRDMGRMIVKEEGNADPLKYSRPWRKDQMSEVLRDAKVSKGNDYVQGIHFDTEIETSWRVIKAMPKLRMITSESWRDIEVLPKLRKIASEYAIELHGFDEEKTERETIYLPSNIRWLQWENCPYKKLRFHDNRHEQLCVLQLPYGRFRNFQSHRMVFPKLKVLNLYGCQYLIETPDFSHLRSLEKLSLDYCLSLTQMDESIGQLEKLVELSLSRCRELKGLPAGLCKLSSLESLDLLECQGISVLPTQIGDLTSLKYLDLRQTSISDVPDSIGSLQSLEMLDLGKCKRIFTLPKRIGDLTSLKKLGLHGTSISVLPDSIGSLQSIEVLDLSKCTFLQQIPDSIGDLKSLRWLSLMKCKLLEQLPNSMGMLTSLQELKIDCCELLREVPDSLGDLNKDFCVFVEGCISLEKLPNFIKVDSSCSIRFDGLKSLRRLPDSLGDGVIVYSLSLQDCASLKELPDSIGMRMVSLVDLSLSGCTLLERIPESIENLKSLKYLCLKNCQSLKELPECIGRLLSLVILDLSGCTLLAMIPETIRYLSRLEHLRLQDCRSLNELPEGIGRLLSLNELELSGCTSIKSIPESIGDLDNLDHLSLEYGLWDSIGKLKPSQQLNLSGCSPLTLKKLHESMEGLKSLRMLSICGGMSVNKLPDFMFSGLMDCETLVLSELEELLELVGEFPLREAIVIEDCPKLESLPQLPSPLTYLGILGCAAFRKLSDPSNLDCLETLFLEGCKAFIDLSGLESLKSLRNLALFDRDGLSHDLMDKLSQASFKKLETLFISGASDGSDLLFGLPKSNAGQVEVLEGMYCLTDMLPSDTSDIRIQVLVEGMFPYEVTCMQTREEDDDDDDDYVEYDNAELLHTWVLGDQDTYKLCSDEEGQGIAMWIRVFKGNTLRIRTTCNYYRLRMAFLEVAYGHEKLPLRMALWPFWNF